MKTSPLAPSGDYTKTLYQDDSTGKGFIIGISGSLAAAWGLKTADERKAVLDKMAAVLIKSYGFDKLNEKEKIYTTHDTEQDFELALANIKWDFVR